MRYLRSLLKRNLPGISEEQAVSIAQAECQRRGWCWGTPIKVVHRRRMWIIHTNWKMRGMNARIEIDSETGEIKEAAYLPR